MLIMGKDPSKESLGPDRENALPFPDHCGKAMFIRDV